MFKRSQFTSAKKALFASHLRSGGLLATSELAPSPDEPLPSPLISAQLQNASSSHSEVSSDTSADDQQVQPSLPGAAAIQSGGSNQPFFFLHGDYKGGAFFCYPLAHLLGPEQPFYVMEPCSFEQLPAQTTLPEMAAMHVTSLRAIQPDGPYLLGGFCNGALIVYEMARQLTAAGQQVELLLLINPVPVAYLRSLRRAIKAVGSLLGLGQEQQLYCFLWLRHMYRYLQHIYRYLYRPYYRQLHRELNAEQVKQDGETILPLKNLYELYLGQDLTPTEGLPSQEDPAILDFQALFPDQLFPSLTALRQDWGYVFYWMVAEYSPASYSGKSTFIFFRDSQDPYHLTRWLNQAHVLDQEVEVCVLNGTEGTCKTKHLRDLASCLYTHLAQVQDLA